MISNLFFLSERVLIIKFFSIVIFFIFSNSGIFSSVMTLPLFLPNFQTSKVLLSNKHLNFYDNLNDPEINW